jgi:hypothetical protein
MDSKLLVGLIKEVVKNEVKQQVKEELAKLIKSGAVTLNSQKKTSTPSLKQISEVNTTAPNRKTVVTTQQRPQPVKQFTNNPILNEVLSQTEPFTAAHRVEGGSMMDESSVLDMIQPQQYEEDGWETMDYRMNTAPQQIPSTGNAGLDALTKALNRDYSDLAKVFTKQEKQKGLR